MADEKYRLGAIYYTLWDVNDDDKGKEVLDLYINVYNRYKQLTGVIKSSCKQIVNFKEANLNIKRDYLNYITAIKSKPFLLLAGISGTGKSRIVRELARACWDEGSGEYEAQKPKNFEMVQVKPNWHDSSELIGYVSRVSGSPVFVAGDFLKFVAKAWENPDVPHFLCLDEMNLAPVEQYFAEYLSVVESRKADGNGMITTDPILKPEKERDAASGNLIPKKWYSDLVMQLLADCPPETMFALKTQFENDGIAIPQNLIVVGTVNMDETTFSFSRKVLDRAMTIEMNEVDLYGGLDDRHEKIGKLEAGNLIGTAVEGVDVYRENKEVCDTALKYLEAVNLNLEGTPFKVAYRTRNEFLLYVVNNLPYNKDKEGNEIPQQEVIARALDEITSMKILSRIEGDSDKIGNLLEELEKTVGEQLKDISGKEYSEKKNDGENVYSVSLAKLKEMEDRLKSGYTSFWS
ncbi:MAG: AAA family ATPase [Prevotella sp.]|nr:AAA family ATPase [Prevotella sp.]